MQKAADASKGENVNDSNTNLKLIIKVIFQLNFQALHDD